MASQPRDKSESSLRRSWLKWCVVLSVLTTLGVAVGAYFWIYREHEPGATAYVEVTLGSPSPAFDKLFDRLPRREVEIRLRSYLTLAKSHLVLQPVVERADIYQLEVMIQSEDPVQWLIDNLQVSYPADGQILELALPKGPDSVELETLLQAVVDSFINAARYQHGARMADGRRRLSEAIGLQEREYEDATLEYAKMTKDASSDVIDKDPHLERLRDEIDVQRGLLHKLREVQALEQLRIDLQPDNVRIIQPAVATVD